jgi:phosphatidylglycerophosphatase A
MHNGRWNHLSTWCGTVCGAGLAPVAPGTVGALIGAAAWWATTLTAYTMSTQLVLIVATAVVGVWAGNCYERLAGRHDPGEFVLDEVCGVLITFAGMAFTWRTLLIGLVLNRFFDIAKPFPISRMQRLPGGYGIMADDMCAGIAGWVMLRLLCLHLC